MKTKPYFEKVQNYIQNISNRITDNKEYIHICRNDFNVSTIYDCDEVKLIHDLFNAQVMLFFITVIYGGFGMPTICNKSVDSLHHGIHIHRLREYVPATVFISSTL